MTARIRAHRHRLVTEANSLHHVFVSALSTGLQIGAAVTLCGAVAAWGLVAPKAKLAHAAPAVPEPHVSGEAAAHELAA